ncbi:hypothetical protein Tco_0198287, partial [Tanacetum coccineum]
IQSCQIRMNQGLHTRRFPAHLRIYQTSDHLEPEAALQAPPSPDYVPGPEEPEQAPPSPDYVPGSEHDDDEIVAEDQPYAEDASPIALSPDYVPESDPEADPEEDGDEDPEEDPIDYPADGGDDGDDEMDIEEDEDDDMDIEADEEDEDDEMDIEIDEETEEEHVGHPLITFTSLLKQEIKMRRYEEL